MIELDLPEPLMWALRWLLLLGPMTLVLAMIRLRNLSQREKIGGLFAFLYGFGMVYLTHSVALWAGWWHYGWNVLMLNGIPADIWVGGAILFGPGLYFSFPNTRPLMMCLPIVIGLHGTVFGALEPLVIAGPNWLSGVIFVFATAHLPAIFLAKWTAEDTHLPLRSTLLAIMFGAVAFVVLPTVVMHAMGGEWALENKSVWRIGVGLACLSFVAMIGLAAVQMLTLQGGGTAIPLDPTKRLVRSGIYAYVSNPMQLSAALSWVILGVFLHNIWVASAAIMAWVFVLGMVRWHHRNDLLKRFPTGWPDYRANVPEWWPRWRPWVPTQARLQLNAASQSDQRFYAWLLARRPTGLVTELTAIEVATYGNPAETRGLSGFTAWCMALTHINFAYTLVGQTMLFACLSLQALRRFSLSKEAHA